MIPSIVNFLSRFHPISRKRKEARYARKVFLKLRHIKSKFNISIIDPEGYLAVLNEIFIDEIYDIQHVVPLNRNYIVFDIGMNRGYASLYFARDSSCYRVYGFEPCTKTFDIAVRNFKENPELSIKIFPSNFGLSDSDKSVDGFSVSGRDGITSTNANFLENYLDNEDGNNSIIIEKMKMKKASSVLMEKMGSFDKKFDFILKIDTEGGEYDIIPELYENSILNKFSLIIGETHFISGRQDSVKIFNIFNRSGFKPLYIKENDKTSCFLFYK